MSVEHYGDSNLVPVWDAEKGRIVGQELSEENKSAWIDSWWYWCPECNMAVSSWDLPEEEDASKIRLCPVCNHEMDDFDWERPLECGDCNWMFPEGYDDGLAPDTMFGDDD